MAALTVDAPETPIRNRLRCRQRGPAVLDGFVADGGLTLNLLPPGINVTPSSETCPRHRPPAAGNPLAPPTPPGEARTP
ncbi:hypothetical protein [Streptomyces sp. NPDC020983]|uniref:hypothetical protein n=1 Tax=Streptomyces sp. NPDC020983 TaxID=3365106 RepID=UPI0037BD1FC1